MVFTDGLIVGMQVWTIRVIVMIFFIIFVVVKSPLSCTLWCVSFTGSLAKVVVYTRFLLDLLWWVGPRRLD